jgi:hypothetical protein
VSRESPDAEWRVRAPEITDLRRAPGAKRKVYFRDHTPGRGPPLIDLANWAAAAFALAAGVLIIWMTRDDPEEE